jgi:hypothetical protein
MNSPPSPLSAWVTSSPHARTPTPSPYRGPRLPAEMMGRAAWCHGCVCLSDRGGEELMAGRGTILTDEIVRYRRRRSGQTDAHQLRRRRLLVKTCPRKEGLPGKVGMPMTRCRWDGGGSTETAVAPILAEVGPNSGGPHAYMSCSGMDSGGQAMNRNVKLCLSRSPGICGNSCYGNSRTGCGIARSANTTLCKARRKYRPTATLPVGSRPIPRDGREMLSTNNGSRRSASATTYRRCVGQKISCGSPASPPWTYRGGSKRLASVYVDGLPCASGRSRNMESHR